MSSYAADWTSLLLRWFHVVAAMAWIGESFYFVMLDRSLTPPRDAADSARGVGGELWSVHGGGFYQARKYRVAPSELPSDLHWSKWKSYATWLSGFGLFTAIYLREPGLYLIDPAVARLSPAAAIAGSLAFLLAGWLVYDFLCRRLVSNDMLLAGAVFLYAVAAAFVATHFFSGRAAFLIVGATLATIMSGNVFFLIIPGQRGMVESLACGEVPDPLPGVLGRQRSTHNTYFTLPVVFTMISNHYAFVYSAPHAWIVLSMIMLGGALVRQFFVLWHGGKQIWLLPAGGALIFGLLMARLAPRSPVAADRTEYITFAAVAPIVAARCAPCHAAHPTLMDSAPQGIMLDTPERIMAQAPAIARQAVQMRAMPLGNATGMTDAERAALGQWVAAGAPR